MSVVISERPHDGASPKGKQRGVTALIPLKLGCARAYDCIPRGHPRAYFAKRADTRNHNIFEKKVWGIFKGEGVQYFGVHFFQPFILPHFAFEFDFRICLFPRE